MKATFHVMGLAHQPTTSRVPHCAYTMKVVNMCKMLRAAGQRVLLYHAGAEAEEGIADGYIDCVPDALMADTYGRRFSETYNQQWDGEDAAWTSFRRKAARTMAQNLGSANDIVLASFGTLHKPSVPSHDAALTIELGVGYEGVFAQHKVFESYAWQHFIYGRQPWWIEGAGNDTVIPNYIDPSMFQYSNKKDDYALYLGRITPEKGVRRVVEACKRAGIRLVLAGKGEPDFLKEIDPTGNVQVADVKERRELLAKARVLVCPTEYIEPFGGIAIEAAYSGTPVISSDTGGFTETVINNRTGFRVRDIAQLVTALHQVDKIDPAVCHEWGQNFTLESVWPRYAIYFEHQLNVYNAR